ncbi:MAG: hypothetical protein HY321_22380 [Armatimonadetes bacterium]|nr:hypothetical protein [Armatimonadota bacterium]
MRVAWLLMAAMVGVLAIPASRAPGQSQSPLRITAPKPGAVVSGTVSIVVEAAEDLALSFVVFGIDGQRPASTNARPYSCAWDTRAFSEGPHILFIEGHGRFGMVATAGPIQVIVRNHEPTVALLASPTAVASRVLPPMQAPAPPAVAPPPIRVPVEPGLVLGGRTLPVAVRILDGHGYVPVRPVVEGLNGTITWDQETHSATAWARDREVKLVLGEPVAVLNGTPVPLWRAPSLEADRLVLPARGCAHLFDLSVAWDAALRLIRLGARGAAAETAILRQTPGK